MKKKLLATALVAALAAALMTGCGSSAPAQSAAPAPAAEAPAAEAEAPAAEAEAAAEEEAEAPAEPEKVENPEYTFYLVRHGQTMFNVRGVAQGWSDSPLTEEGIAMPKKLHESFKDIPFDACYTSISERAYDTANYIIEGRDIPLYIDENLKETNCGSLEGLEDPVPMIPDRLVKGWTEEGGETIAQTAERFKTAIEKIIADNPNGGTFLVTSHGGAITGYLDMMFGETDTWADFLAGEFHGSMPNCATSIMHYANGEYTIESISDVSYLQ